MFLCKFGRFLRTSFLKYSSEPNDCSDSSSKAPCLDIKIKTSKWQIKRGNILKFEIVFAFWDKFGSYHPQQVLKILEILKGNLWFCNCILCTYCIDKLPPNFLYYKPTILNYYFIKFHSRDLINERFFYKEQFYKKR